MSLLAGNWSPVQKIQQPLREVLQDRMEKTVKGTHSDDSKLHEYVSLCVAGWAISDDLPPGKIFPELSLTILVISSQYRGISHSCLNTSFL